MIEYNEVRKSSLWEAMAMFHLNSTMSKNKTAGNLSCRFMVVLIECQIYNSNALFGCM